MACEIKGCKAKTKNDRCDKHMFVRCPSCWHEQADMGVRVSCEECGEGPMPTY